MSASRYLSADEAAAELGVSKSTLYAYVSRGLIRSEATAGSRRTKRYYGDDVHRLKRRHAQRRTPSQAARTALDFGLPVLESGLTLIDEGRLSYRGHDACKLARTRSLPAVALLLWRGDLEAPWPVSSALALPQTVEVATRGGPPALACFEAALPAAALQDESAFDYSGEGIARTGARVMHLMQAVLTGETPGPAPPDLARALLERWGGEGPASLVRAALVLCADHELNVTAMAARCAASAGASPYRAAQAGMAALRGQRHAGGMARVEAMLEEAGTPGGLRATLAARQQRGDAIPGFGHRLYHEGGDPRARLLAEQMSTSHPDAEGTAFMQAAAHAGPDLLGRAPNVSLALVALRRVLGWPAEAALTLFAAGRAVGWIGHAREQYEDECPIRPRATYTGPPPRG